MASVGLITGTVALALYGMGIAIGGGVVAASGFGGLGTQIAVPIIGLTKSISFAVIKDWNNAQSAKALSIGFEVGKTATNESLSAAGHRVTGKAGIVTATSVSVDGDLLIMQEAQRKAAALADRNVMEAEAKLARMQHARIGGQTVKGAKQRAVRVAAQRGIVAAERQSLQHASQDLFNATEKVVADTLEREALKAARAQALRRAGKVLVGGATTVFAVWDLYDAVAELGE